MNRSTSGIFALVSMAVLIGVMVMAGKAFGAREYQALPGSGFTYQGQLKQNNIPTDNTCDFRFSLWTASSDGSQVGDDQVSTGIDVKDGYFSIPNLDFGGNAFNGEARWLEIEVKCIGDTLYTTLTPRQPVTPAPYALALPGLYTQQNDVSPNVLGGFHGNQAAEGVYGAAIGGGGTEGSLNQVTDHYGTVAGGANNRAGNNDAIIDNSSFATVGGGENNTASSDHALVAGGGNNSASAAYAVIGGGRNNVAKGSYSVVSGGKDNQASGIGAFVGGGESNSAANSDATVSGGRSNTAAGDFATIPGGYQAETSQYGQMAYASGSFSESGDAQSSIYVLRNFTTDATAKELFLDGASTPLTIPENRTLAFEIYIVARRDAYAQSAGYIFRGLIKNDGGETKFTGSPSKVTIGEDNPAWDVTLSSSDALDALIIYVNGAENANIRWVATVRTVEVAW